jgi:AraC-like DNA-binding protein
MIVNKLGNCVRYSWKTGFCPYGKSGFSLSNPDSFEYCWCCPENLGDGTFRRIEIRSGFEIWITDCLFKRDALFSCHDTPSFLVFSFYLSGRYHATIGRNQTQLELCGKQQGIFFFTETDGIGRVESTVPIRNVSVMMSPERLFSYFENEPSRIPPMLRKILGFRSTDDLCHTADMPPAFHPVLFQIMHCPFRGVSRKLFLESRALELIALQLERIDTSKQFPGPTRIMHPDDRKRTDYAKSLLFENIENPPTLFELSRAAGMSHPKLNRCFRQMYGMTVFECLRKERLDRAREMLEHQGRTVTEAAFTVGYDSISHFSQAYKKHFGLSPSAYSRTIRSDCLTGNSSTIPL